jgi:hypothetical protein
MQKSFQLFSLTSISSAILFFISTFVSCSPEISVSQTVSSADEIFYLTQVRNDFIKHKEDVTTIYNIAGGIVKRIDSLINGLIKNASNADLINGIMTTRAYNTTILAYKDILNGNYISDADLKLKIARHVAWFEGIVASKRHWDEQWDQTARPYLYNNGLFKSGDNQYNLIADPVFRSVLWDRRMFAHDVEIYTPQILASADSVIAAIDLLLKK